MRREQQAAQPGAEGRQADALARIGQQDLPDHLVDVVLIGRLRGLAGGGVDAERKGEIVARDHRPLTFGLGRLDQHRALRRLVPARHRPTLASVSTKSPPCFTFCAVCTHCTVTQGLRHAGDVKVQPAMMKRVGAAQHAASAVALVAARRSR